MLRTLINTYHHSIADILNTALYYLPEGQKAEKENGIGFCFQVPYIGIRLGSL